MKILKKTGVFFLAFIFCPFISFSQVTNDDVKKEASRLFEDEEFTKAYKLYSQLVANYPKEPEYNYRLGVCMLYSEPDKKKCLPYLKQAAAAGKEAPKDAFFYLGKAYHVNYLFDEALKAYNEFRKTASSSLQKKLQVDREIKACENGKHLLSNLTDLVVQNKKQLNETDYFRSYDLKSIGGKLLVKPEDFKSSADKKKKERSVVFLPKGSDVVYYSSYGEKGETGKDIYTASKLPNGTFSAPQKVSGINTEYDEDYPFLHPNGKTLYFASKGHNSMGGYDIFKTTFNENTNSWSAPENLEFPINSPDDDYLFVTDSLEKTAYFSTGRQSPPGKIDVLKINTERKPIDVLVIKGTVVKESADQSLESVIEVKKASGEAVGTFSASGSGSYTLELPNGAELMFTVSTPGLKTQNGKVTLPLATSARPYKQTIAYESGELKIINEFDVQGSDDNYLQYLKVIEKKAKLEVNEGENKLEAPDAGKEVASADPPVTQTKSATPQILTESGSGNKKQPPVAINNKKLSEIAREDAAESKMEAAQLQRDAKEARATGEKQKAEADQKLVEAATAIQQAESIADKNERATAIEQANAKKQNAKSEQAVAIKILELAETLEEDARNKQKEADLNQKYATELERAITGTDPSSIKKLEELEKQIEETKKSSESGKLISNLKADLDQKEKLLSDNEQENISLRSSAEEIKTTIAAKETELNKTRKKSAKEKLQTELTDLRNEQTVKEKQIAANETERATLNEDISALRVQLDAAGKVRPGAPTDEKKTEVASSKENETQTATGITNAPAEQLASKYQQAITAEPAGKEDLENNISELKKYNDEIETALSLNSRELDGATDETAKTRLEQEKRSLESAKEKNNTLLNLRNERLKTISTGNEPVAVANNSSDAYAPVTAATKEEAITRLETIEQKVNTSETANFEYNSYSDPAAQSLKVEADSKINDAAAKQKKLLEEISLTKQELNSNSNSATQNDPAELNRQAEELLTRSQKLQLDAKDKQGAEKQQLLSEATRLEEQANETLIKAADATASANNENYKVNSENIVALTASGNSSETDKTEAARLNSEAGLAFKQASAIRKEAETVSNKGAKLGSLSNAEEKEAEAILKQQQAIDLLKKSNPQVPLKVVTKNPEQKTGTPDLSNVNKTLAELAEIKLESYNKLYSANEAEIAALQAKVNQDATLIDGTPALKTDRLLSEASLEESKKLKTEAEASASSSERLDKLSAAVRKQTQAIKQMNTLNDSVAKFKNQQTPEPVATVTETPTGTNGQTETNPPEGTDGNTVSPAATETTTTAETKEETPAVSTGSIGSSEPVIAAEPPVRDSNTSVNDTTVEQALSFIESQNVEIKNPQAGGQVKTSLERLKSLQREEARLKQNNNQQTEGYTPSQMKGLSDSLMIEVEQLGATALEKRRAAEGKTGEEKNRLISEAKEIEDNSHVTWLRASELNREANEMVTEANDAAISELLGKLKTDDPELSATLDQKYSEASVLKTQAKNLRDEANSLSNVSARVGAYGNAEEKEAELIQKQTEILIDLKRKYPEYSMPEPKAQQRQPVATEETLQRIRKEQFSALTDLTNGYTLEFEASKRNLPSNLKEEDARLKKEAEELNASSKELLIRSSKSNDAAEKTALLSRAARSGNEALAKLSGIKTASPALTALNEIGNTINGTPAATPTVAPLVNPSRTTSNGTVRIEGLEVIRGNAYSNVKPIPMDAKMPEGLIFRVQVGAFRTALPNNAFRGLSPLNGETTPNGYFRYTAGNFNRIENANAVKNDLRNLGYSDAFVVAYYNGKRLSLAEALQMLAKEGRTIDPNAPQTAGITANVNVPKAAVNTAIQEPVTVSQELEKTNGLLFTIQIGVYNKAVSRQRLLNLRPVFTEQLSNGLYRYTAGIYNNTDRLAADKRRVVDLGVRDAFVSAYFNGKRMPFAEAKTKLNEPGINIVAENPIIFPGSAGPIPGTAPAPAQPFNNGVTRYPEPTTENGVKTDEQGLSYKVQIGAFSKQVPPDVAAKFSAIRTWPVENRQQGQLYIYTIGNFTGASFAKALKDEAVRIGITDAFVTVYRDGKKLYGEEARQNLK